jgi:hypothetical protein
MMRFLSLAAASSALCVQFSQAQPPVVSGAAEAPARTISQICFDELKKFDGPKDEKLLQAACDKAELMPGCESVQKVPIYHYNKQSTKKSPQNILVFSLIHGDEIPAGSVGRFWMERLEGIENPRNNWRVVPILNPDGLKAKTRTNANLVDVNRNFPTKDWEEKAKAYWQRDHNSNPRRFPGNAPASEPETLCALKHIEDFKPDFVVSIHTPLRVLDFDGPKVKKPNYDYLPWKSLGHYPGSLGRFMWFERQVPVLTMELRDELPRNLATFEQLQDIIGVLVGLELGPRKPAQEDSKTAESTTQPRTSEEH